MSEGPGITTTTSGSTRAPGPARFTSHLIDRVYRHYVRFPNEYCLLLDRIHQHIVPRTYVEIGVSKGRTLTIPLPGTVAIGVDPEPKVMYPLGRDTRVFTMTSDDFFAHNDLRQLLGGRSVDLAFIDGMHLFEFALRDFMNIERHASKATTVLVHDCYPVSEVTAERERVTQVWSGDIWRLTLCLKQWRPDLRIVTVDIPPAGMAIIRGLDPESTVLADHYDEIVETIIAIPYARLEEGGKAEMLNAVPNDWAALEAMLPERQRRLFSLSGFKVRRALRGATTLARRRYRRARRRFKGARPLGPT